MDVPFNSLAGGGAAPVRALLDRLAAVVDRGWYLSGPETEAFEHEFAEWLGLPPDGIVGVGNGTDALELALAALQLPPGSRVATAANAGGYATTAVRLRGLEPVHVDVEPTTGLMNADSVAQALDQDVSAVVVTHLYGKPVDRQTVISALRDRSIPVIEDCAQAHGARSDGARVGSLGTLATFSFYPTKNLGALGDAGAVASADPELASRVRALARYGWTTKYRVETAGGRNSRIDELQAAVLRLRLPGLSRANRRRAEIAAAYRASIDHPDIELDAPVDGEVHHLFTVRSPERDALADWLARHGIGTAVHYPVADHLQPAWRAADEPPPLPVTEHRARTLLSLPCHPLLRDRDLEHVIRTCNAFQR